MIWPVAALAVFLLGFVIVYGSVLALPGDAALLDELRNVRLRESSPGVYRLDHDRSRHDDRAIALAIAAMVGTTGTSPTPRSP